MPSEPKLKKVIRRRPKVQDAASEKRISEQYQPRAVTRALDVLDSFRDGTSAYSLKELARFAHMPESSLFRLLVTLESRGYLRQAEDGTYRLSDKLLYGKLHERAEMLRERLHPQLLKLARLFNETTSMAFLFGNHITVLDSIESFHDMRVINRIGRVLPPYASSMGKAITAFQERPMMDSIVEAYGLFRRTDRTITDRLAIYEEFEEVRRVGYAYDRGEATEGGICIGAPIPLSGGHVELAISISVPNMRMGDDRQAEVIKELLAATRKMAAVAEEKP